MRTTAWQPSSSGNSPTLRTCGFVSDLSSRVEWWDAAKLTRANTDTDGNWDETSIYGNPPFFQGTNEALFATIPAVVNKRVYDILGVFLTDWFDFRPAEPDVFLQDCAEALYHEYRTRTKKFIRNVFTEPAYPQTPRAASACPDPAAPLYTDCA